MRPRKQYIAFDTETDGLFRHKGDRMFAFAECDRDGEAAVYRADHQNDRYRGRLEELWSRDGARRYAKICHNARFDLGMTEAALGRKLRNDGHEVHETMALSHIFDNLHYNHALGDLAWDLFRYKQDDDEQTKAYMNSELGLAACPEYVLTPYQVADVQRTMLLFRHYYPKLAEMGYEEIYQMERDLVWTTLAIEDRGVMVSRSRTRKLQDWCRREAEAALQQYRAITGSTGTPMSADVGEQLHRLGFDLKTKTRTGRIATRKDALADLREKTKHPVFDAILKYRSYDRGVSILDGYLEHADADGVVHPGIHPYGTRTGRESCKNPNLQNVSKETTLRNPFPIPARQIFVPKPGYVNFHLDYSAIEARLLVHLSQDKEALEIMRSGGDFHAAAAECFYGERFRLATGKGRKALRDAAKNGDFAIGYGAGAGKLAMTLGLSAGEGRAAYERFRARFPGYAGMSARMANQVRAEGFVKTIFGRKLSVSRNKPYAGTNYSVQGGAAGIFKRGQNRADGYLHEATGGEAGIVLPIHDELIIEWPRKRLGEAREHLARVAELMVDFPQLSVPLVIDCEVSTRDWMHAEEYDLAA